jgi:hypothetical protein
MNIEICYLRFIGRDVIFKTAGRFIKIIICKNDLYNILSELQVNGYFDIFKNISMNIR